MTPADLKGHLLARSANLEQERGQLFAALLVAEDRAKELRGRVHAVQGAQAELALTLQLLEPTARP